jgi:tetratricopeptide (TPR) repeat protein
MAVFAERSQYLKGNVEKFRKFALLLERKYRSQDLLKLAKLSVELAADNVDILLFASRILGDQRDFSNALLYSEKALQLEPGLIEAKVLKGRSLYGLGKRIEAFEILDEVMKEDAADGDANYYYSRILADEKIDHDRATNMARSALRAFYSDEKAFVNICEVYTAFGDHKYAYGDAIKASTEFPNSPEIFFELGLASYNLGRANTDQHLKKGIDLGLGGEKLKIAKQILAKL